MNIETNFKGIYIEQNLDRILPSSYVSSFIEITLDLQGVRVFFHRPYARLVGNFRGSIGDKELRKLKIKQEPILKKIKEETGIEIIFKS